MKSKISLLTFASFIAMALPLPAQTVEVWKVFYETKEGDIWKPVQTGFLESDQALTEFLDQIQDGDQNTARLYRNADGNVTGIHGGVFHDFLLIEEPEVTTAAGWNFTGNGEFKYVVKYDDGTGPKFKEFTKEELEAAKNNPAITILSDKPFYAEKLTASQETVVVKEARTYYIIQVEP